MLTKAMIVRYTLTVVTELTKRRSTSDILKVIGLRELAHSKSGLTAEWANKIKLSNQNKSNKSNKSKRRHQKSRSMKKRSSKTS